jgi:hypothetical protein
MKINLSIETEYEEQNTMQVLNDLSFSYQLLARTAPGLPTLNSTRIDLGGGKYRMDFEIECTKDQIKNFSEVVGMESVITNEIFNN